MLASAGTYIKEFVHGDRLGVEHLLDDLLELSVRMVLLAKSGHRISKNLVTPGLG